MPERKHLQEESTSQAAAASHCGKAGSKVMDQIFFLLCPIPNLAVKCDGKINIPLVYETGNKLDGVGPIDNRSSGD